MLSSWQHHKWRAAARNSRSCKEPWDLGMDYQCQIDVSANSTWHQSRCIVYLWKVHPIHVHYLTRSLFIKEWMEAWIRIQVNKFYIHIFKHFHYSMPMKKLTTMGHKNLLGTGAMSRSQGNGYEKRLWFVEMFKQFFAEADLTLPQFRSSYKDSSMRTSPHM